jgi:hypothetical protein
MADESREEYKLFDDKREEMKPIFDRNDVDEALYFMKPFKMMQLDGKKEMEDVANITLNDALIYVQKCISILGGANMQIVIEGKGLSDTKTNTIEQFLKDIFYIIDEQLPKRKIPGLDSFLNEQLGVRGRIAARICIRIDPVRGLVPDVLPLDTRCYTDDIDGKDLVWAAPWFRQSKAQIEREYTKPGDRLSAVKIESYAEVVDFWDPEKNVVFVDKQIIREQPNPYGYVPFVCVICPTGSSLGTEDAVEHQGESFLWANRDLWDMKNEAVTILRTLNIDSLARALQYESSHGENMPKPEKSPYKQKTVHGVEKGGGYKFMPISDIKNATRLYYSIIETGNQRGSLSAIDYGTLGFPLSNVAITQLTGSRDDIFLPRVNTKAWFYQSGSRMIIKQCIQLDENLELGQEGSKNSYTKADLEGDYSIQYTFRSISKEQQMADLQFAIAARGVLPDDYVIREIIKAENPTGMLTQLRAERAERIDEVLFLFNSANSLLEEKNGQKPSIVEKLEADILTSRAETILAQRRAMGQLSPIEGKAKEEAGGKKAEEAAALLTAGGGGTRGSPETTKGEEVANV